jgi:hypothetical protein
MHLLLGCDSDAYIPPALAMVTVVAACLHGWRLTSVKVTVLLLSSLMHTTPSPASAITPASKVLSPV